MEHLTSAAHGTPCAEAIRLLGLDPEKWTYEDLQFSEGAMRSLIKHDYPVILVHRLKQRHTRATRRLLASETSTEHNQVLLAAERILRAGGGK